MFINYTNRKLFFQNWIETSLTIIPYQWPNIFVKDLISFFLNDYRVGTAGAPNNIFFYIGRIKLSVLLTYLINTSNLFEQSYIEQKLNDKIPTLSETIK